MPGFTAEKPNLRADKALVQYAKGKLGGFASTIRELVLAAWPNLHALGSSQQEHMLRDLPRDLQYTSTNLDCSMREEQHHRESAKDESYLRNSDNQCKCVKQRTFPTPK